MFLAKCALKTTNPFDKIGPMLVVLETTIEYVSNGPKQSFLFLAILYPSFELSAQDLYPILMEFILWVFGELSIEKFSCLK